MARTKGSRNGYSKDPNYKPVGKPAKKDYSYNGKVPSVRPHYNPAAHYSNMPKAHNVTNIGSIRETAMPAEKYGHNSKAYSKVSVPSIRNKKMKYYDTYRDADGNILAKYVDKKRTEEFASKQKEYEQREKKRVKAYKKAAKLHKANSDYNLQNTVKSNMDMRKLYEGKGKVRVSKYGDTLSDEEKERRRKWAPIEGLIKKGKRKVKKFIDMF